jgi:hypothetical protein
VYRNRDYLRACLVPEEGKPPCWYVANHVWRGTVKVCKWHRYYLVGLYGPMPRRMSSRHVGRAMAYDRKRITP